MAPAFCACCSPHGLTLQSLPPPTVRPLQVIKPPLLKAGFELVQREKLEVSRLDQTWVRCLLSTAPRAGAVALH